MAEWPITWAEVVGIVTAAVVVGIALAALAAAVRPD